MQNGAIEGSFEYNSDVFEQITIKRFITHFNLLLDRIVEQPNLNTAELDLLTVAEFKQLVSSQLTVQTNDSIDYCCLHELFEIQVAKAPKNTALVWEREEISYEELNDRANQVANQLHALNVKPEQIIGLYIDRSPEMIVGLIGILKAGCAYLPLDPAYPKERTEFMLRDAKARIVSSFYPFEIRACLFSRCKYSSS